MENLKCVVRHHSVGLINVFKQDLVGFTNELWSYSIITGAVKDNILDSSKGGVDLRASNLLSSICNTLSPLQNRSEQYVYMKFVLDMLEKAGESPLATSMRTELASMGVDIPPLYANPMPDVRDRQFNTEPVGNEYTVPHMYETQKRKQNESIVPTFQPNVQPQTDSASSVVPPTTKVDRKVSFSKSDSVISYQTPYKQEYTNKFPLPETQPHDNEDQHLTSTGTTTRPYSEQFDGPSLNGTQQSLDKLHMQEQKDIYNRLITKYEQEIKDLRSSLKERDQRLQEKTDLERTEATNSKLIARYEQENKDLKSRLDQLQVKYDRLIETQERQRQRDSLLYRAVIAVSIAFVCYNYFSRR